MEHIHGVDVSWMTHGNPKDKATKTAAAARQRSWSQTSRDATPPAPISPTSTPTANGNQAETPTPSAATQASPKTIPASRSGFSKSSSFDEKKSGSPGTSPSRRGSWFSNISSKFSSGNHVTQSPPQASNATPKPAELSVPKANPVKNAVLQHASRHEGEGPYTPAPPRSSQQGILHVFRRLSASNGSLSPGQKANNHGLVERRVLNVDRHRERCDISGLNQAKLRRVSFCVDVEIAPMPKYGTGDTAAKKPAEKGEKDKVDKAQKKKIVEKAEGDALKQSKPLEPVKEDDTTELQEKPASKERDDGLPNATTPAVETKDSATEAGSQEAPSDAAADKSSGDRKKEKKKKSEEERKARKERKRKLAEANGTIPMEIYIDSDDSESAGPTTKDAPKVQAAPTTNPVRIYRRCCQLRETPILKKITEQLTNPSNCSGQAGVVEKLDLTGYWMQLADLVTLGDYLAVVPVKELILENCGLTDEGLRVILAGLLAVSRPDNKRRKLHNDLLTPQGGVVERLVLKNNKIGPEGWKHICLFVYLCRTLKCLDVSTIPFPKPAAGNTSKGASQPLDICALFSKSLSERLAGSTLGLVNLGETGISTEQLGRVIDGVIKCGIKRLGLAHNEIDAKGMQHVAKFLEAGAEGLDLAGNNLRDQLPVIADTLKEDHPLWALSLAECNLEPSSLCKLFPRLVSLKSFRFIDLSHNHDLFKSEPNAVKILRRYLPLMTLLKRIHLTDCALNSSQVIAIAEILPEVQSLAHISLLENPDVMALTNANTEEKQEEAVALFASLLAAARVSTTLVAVDIEVPSEQSGELVKAMARQVVAYCLRNMERVPLNELTAAAMAQTEEAAKIDPEYPVVLQHLVGHDIFSPSSLDSDVDAAPDDDYVIGGTGVVKALTCCLENRGDESRRQSGDFAFAAEEGGIPIPQRKNTGGKAKEASKHLLSTARKIRERLQPAIAKARRAPVQDNHAFNRLLFLDNTLKGIIKRFEDEFPDTRESIDSGIAMSSSLKLGSSVSSGEADLYPTTTISDDGEGEDEVEVDLGIKSPSLSRSNSVLSTTSKALADEEARILRAGHKFRSAIVKPEHWMLLTGIKMVAANPRHTRMLHEMLDELGLDDLLKEADEKGIVAVFEEHREELAKTMKEADPEHWERFKESQEMAKANTISVKDGETKNAAPASTALAEQITADENAVAVTD